MFTHRERSNAFLLAFLPSPRLSSSRTAPSFSSLRLHSFLILHEGNDHTNFRHLYATRQRCQRGST